MTMPNLDYHRTVYLSGPPQEYDALKWIMYLSAMGLLAKDALDRDCFGDVDCITGTIQDIDNIEDFLQRFSDDDKPFEHQIRFAWARAFGTRGRVMFAESGLDRKMIERAYAAIPLDVDTLSSPDDKSITIDVLQVKCLELAVELVIAYITRYPVPKMWSLYFAPTDLLELIQVAVTHAQECEYSMWVERLDTARVSLKKGIQLAQDLSKNVMMIEYGYALKRGEDLGLDVIITPILQALEDGYLLRDVAILLSRATAKVSMTKENGQEVGFIAVLYDGVVITFRVMNKVEDSIANLFSMKIDREGHLLGPWTIRRATASAFDLTQLTSELSDQ